MGSFQRGAMASSLPMTPMTVAVHGAEDMTEEQRLSVGLNVSNTHVDFMIGTEDLWVTGITKSGDEVPVIRDGIFMLDY